ncbi:MAG: EMC3/TMCO1 family protein [Candidatus Thorarchaeota archaeon]
MQDFISDFINYLAAFFEPVSKMPYSAPFILVVSVLLALVSIVLTNKLTDPEKMKEDMEEVKAWQAKFNEARKTGDPQLLQEVMDSQSRIMRLQSNMMSSRCKPMLIFYIPFILIFSVLAAIYGNNPVAILPFNVTKVFPWLEGMIGVDLPGTGFGLTYFPLYMLSGFGLGNLIRRAAGQQMM